MNNQSPPDKLLRLSQVLQLIPISKSAWWAGVKTGKYPASVKLGPRTTCWKASDIQQVISAFSCPELKRTT
ncbi:MAG: AlpA family phage regulatory protein [SAR324 cluster bacterium]|nr:AlpA family phage regulatory protein [SAR324 cluster bacterium]